jgi:hypothetical protein
VKQPPAVPIEDRRYLCPLCPAVPVGPDGAAAHATTEHTDATELRFLDLDDPGALPDDFGTAY